MGSDLYNVHGHYYRFGLIPWHKMIALASSYGWKPKGALVPGSQERTQDYLWNGGQFVEPDDANALANALEKSLKYIPEKDHHSMGNISIHDVDFDKLDNQLAAMLRPFLYYPDGNVTLINPNISPVEFFAGPRRHKICDFIRFCREAG